MNVSQTQPTSSVFFAANDGNIEMIVGEPLLVKTGLSQCHSYPIKGKDSNGEVEC